MWSCQDVLRQHENQPEEFRNQESLMGEWIKKQECGGEVAQRTGQESGENIVRLVDSVKECQNELSDLLKTKQYQYNNEHQDECQSS